MRAMRLKAHLFGGSKGSQSKLVKAINTQVRYKGREAVNLLPALQLCSCILLPPRNGR